MRDYYKDKKFKPRDKIYYIEEDEIDKIVIGTVVTLKTADKAYKKTNSYANTKSIIEDESPSYGIPIFANFSNGYGIGWMPQQEVKLYTETVRLLYGKDDERRTRKKRTSRTRSK